MKHEDKRDIFEKADDACEDAIMGLLLSLLAIIICMLVGYWIS
jgi:hypothetical protein